MGNRFLLLFSVVIFQQILFAQGFSTALDKPKTNVQLWQLPMNDTLPSWVKLMVSASPNFYNVENEFNEYYKSHPFVKNKYTRHFKHWKYFLLKNKYLKADGSIFIPSENERATEAIHWQREKAAFISKRTIRSSHTWEFIGPHLNRGPNLTISRSATSCMSRMAIFKLNKNIMYATSENGIISKTIDHGENWEPIGFTDLFETGLGTGDEQVLEIHPTNADIVYYGVKNKIWKSTNGGTSWTELINISGLKPTKLLIHPTNPDTIYLSSYLGVYRSANGGTSFTMLRAGKAWDIQLKTNQPSNLFGIFQNGTKSDFYKSTNSGATWNASLTGWFADAQEYDDGGRMAVSTSNPNLIWCFILGKVVGDTQVDPLIGVAKSTDAGATWTRPITYNNRKGIDGVYGFRTCAIGVSQTNDNRVMVGNFEANITQDGFNTVTKLSWSSYQHEDIQQCLFVDDNNMWVCSDGGIDKYSADLTSRITKSNKLYSDIWGYDQGWNEDVRAATFYHNGVGAYKPSYPDNNFRSLTTGEPTLAYVNIGDPCRVYFSPYPGGRNLSSDITETNVGTFSYAVQPNSGVGDYTNSTIRTHPQYYHTQYLGFEHKLYKTIDNGATFTIINTFGTNANSRVCAIEISRSNPDVIYVHQLIRNTNNNGWTTGILWKTTDAGTSWTEIIQPVGAPLTDGLYIQIDPLNSNNIWIGYNKTSSMNKVFRSTDGGATWINLSTTTLDGKLPMSMLHIGGTDGGIVLVTRYGVFYRNNTMSDWDLYGNNLPGDVFARYVRPFYKEGKIRIATSHRGLWSVELYEQPTTVIVQATVNIKYAECQQDTFRFDDYSMVNHIGASWSWSFPGASFVSNSSIRNPKVLYPTQGSYTATMTLTTPLGTFTSTLVVTILNTCTIQPYATKAAILNGTTSSNVKTIANAPDFGTSQSFSISFWVKTNTTSSDASIITDKNWNSGGNKGWVFAYQNGKIKFNLGDGSSRIDLNSQTGLNDDQWHHVAVTVTRPGQAIMYVDGIQRSSASTTILVNTIFTGFKMVIGSDVNDNYKFSGIVDEIRIWNAPLSQATLREKRHLTSIANETNLLMYYQFNALGSTEFDFGSSGNHLVFGSNAMRQVSTAPVGGGTSFRMTVNSGGIKDFTGTDCQIEFPGSGTYPNGELCVTRIDTMPNDLPINTTSANKQYWIINNYGSNSSFSPLTQLKLSNFNVTSTTPSDYGLYKRISNGHQNNQWTSEDVADVIITGILGSTTFNTGLNITSFSQFYLSRPTCSAQVNSPENIGLATLRDVLSCISSGDTIKYRPDINTNLSDSLLVYKGVVIKGNGISQTAINMAYSNGKGIVIPAGVTLSLMDLMLVIPISMGPVIVNNGTLILDNTSIQGNSTINSIVLNQGAGTVTIRNNSVIKK